MHNKLTFAIDCDEVLRSLLSNMIALYNREFNENVHYEEVSDFVVDVSFPKIKEACNISASQWFFQDHSTELFLESDALPNTKKAVEILQKYGDVIVVTYQKTYKNKLETLSWLEKNGIFPEGICFLKNKTIIHPTYFIDDNTWNFIGCNAEHGILITAPYNKNESIEQLYELSNCKTLHRFDSLYEFAEYYDKSMNEITTSDLYTKDEINNMCLKINKL